MILNPRPLSVLAPGAPASVRQRELEAGRLVLAAAAAGSFVARRAADDARALGPGPARRALVHAADACRSGDQAAARSGLLAYGAVLERHGLHVDAGEVYRGVLTLFGDDAHVALHAGRAARRASDRAEAMRLYAIAARHANGETTLTLLARMGAALLADDPIAELASVIHAARRARAWEAYAIGREERARLERAAGRSGAAVRDLVAALRRYPDRQDRMRVLHALADLLIARGDLAGAREALLAALELARPSARGHTVHRLRMLARLMGDELELLRSRGSAAPTIVTLMPPRERIARDVRSLAPRLRRMRDLMSPRSTAAE